MECSFLFSNSDYHSPCQDFSQGHEIYPTTKESVVSGRGKGPSTTSGQTSGAIEGLNVYMFSNPTSNHNDLSVASGESRALLDNTYPRTMSQICALTLTYQANCFVVSYSGIYGTARQLLRKRMGVAVRRSRPSNSHTRAILTRLTRHCDSQSRGHSDPHTDHILL